MAFLPFAHYRSAYLREVQPRGWIKTFLQTQAAGLTSHPEAHGYPYGLRFWGSSQQDSSGSYADWWPYEQTAYWIDGALKCGYLTGQKALYGRALSEVEFALEHAAPDGFIGPAALREKDRWPHAVFFRAVLAQYEITGDPRYLEALARHYQALPHPLLSERDVTGVEALLLLYQETADASFYQLARQLYQRFNDCYPDHDCALQTLLSDKKPAEHGVTFNEIAKLGALLYMADGSAEALSAALNGYAKLESYARLADGMHSCSEHIRGSDPLDSHETCDLSDYTWALGYLLQATGEVSFADRIEKVIFNALPGAVTQDFKALQYFSCPNQVIASATSNHNAFLRGYNWMAYRPDHEVQCCPGNVHRTLPNYVQRMWLRTAGTDDIVAALFGPGQLQSEAGGSAVTITAETAYPFEQGVTFHFALERPARFGFSARIPTWCRQPRLSINGAPGKDYLAPGAFFRIERSWQPGDVLRLELPFELRLEHWPGGGISLDYGPLTLALPIKARAEIERENSTLRQRREIHGERYVERPYEPVSGYPAWNLFPDSPWNYALCLDETALAENVQVTWETTSAAPFDPAAPGLRVRVPARKVAGWELVHTEQVTQTANWIEGADWKSGEREIRGEFSFTPPLPDPASLPGRLEEEVEWIELVPYGATLLRLTVFPQAKAT